MTMNNDDTQPDDGPEHPEADASDQQDDELPDHTEPQPGAAVKATRSEDGGLSVSFSDGSSDLEMSRREFLRVSGVATASAAMSGVNCRYPKEEIVPYVDRPEQNRPGQAEYYTSVYDDGSGHHGILVKTRSGRPIKLKGNPDHPINEGSLSARGEAAHRRLYDPDRAESPKAIEGRDQYRDLNWKQLDEKVVAALEGAASVRILTRGTTGSASEGLLGEIADRASDMDVAHYEWEPLTSEALQSASDQCFGSRHVPHYHFDRADVIISLGSDFLGSWHSPTEFTGDWADNRDPNEEMSRLVAFEGHMTMTGSNADDRYRVRPSNLVYVALALAHEVILEHGHGSFADDSAIQSALEPFAPAAVAEAIGPERLTGDEVESLEDVLVARAEELVEHAGSGLVVAGSSSRTADGISLESAVNLLNAALGNEGETIERARPSQQDTGSFEDLQTLVDEMQSGEVDVLIVDGANPIYSAPPELSVEEAMGNVDMVVSTHDRINETAARGDLLATGNHFLESWGDAEPYSGLHSIQQPAIQPLYETRAFEESLIVWFGQSGIVSNLQSYLEGPEDPNPGGKEEGDDISNVGPNVPYDPGAWYRYIRDHWKQEMFPAANALADFRTFWQGVLQEGVWKGPEDHKGSEPAFRPEAAVESLPDNIPEAGSGDPGDLSSKELHMFATVPMYDGRHANNGHLQELPDRITKHTWGSYVLVSPTTYREADLEQGDVLEIEPADSDETLEFPVIVQPGMHDDVVAVPVGYGRTHAGVVGNDIGENAFYFSQFDDGQQVLSGMEAELTPTGDNQEMSIVQGAQVLDIHERPILPTATLDAYEDDDHAGVGAHPPGKGLWDAHDYDLKWGMSIDLSTCTGCGACVTACQEENNVPVVGRKGVLEGREMHWLRIDRYYLLPSKDQNPELHEQREDLTDDPMYGERPLEAFAREYPEEFDNPPTRMEPMLCQHCERAPCETVCPVAATTHSEDGLNQMTYNRCVGTRYCANNCPYKVRRYNWFNYSSDRRDSVASDVTPELDEHGRLNMAEPLPMSLNPDVTVRSRGVMEKCTFCVQRIRRAKWQKKEENRDHFREDDVKTACEEACPAGAIEFGALVQEGADEKHQVQKDHESPRALAALSSLNTKPSVAYLTDVRNTRQRSSRSQGGHGGGHGDSKGGGSHGEGSHGKGDHGGSGSHGEGHGGGDNESSDHGGGSNHGGGGSHE